MVDDMAGDESNPKNEPDKIDMLDRCKYTFDQVNSWISNAESKVSISCGIFTGIFGVITFLAERIKEPTATTTINKCWQCIYGVTFILGLVIMGISILFYVLAINPNIKSNETGIKKVPLFYGDINKLCNCQYKEAILNASEKDFFDEILNEAHFNSAICTRKMRMYKRGLWLSFAAVGMAAISWIAHFLMYNV